MSGCSVSPRTPHNNSDDGYFRVGTYNVKDMFDDVDDPGKSDDIGTDESRLRAIAEIILESECDILAMQEVENIDVLQDFNRDYLDGSYSDVILIEGNDPRGIDVGVLSKFRISGVRSYRDREFAEGFTGSTIKFSRDLLAVSFIDSRGDEWSLLTTHLKSGRGGHNSIRRTSQADEVAKIVREGGYVNSFGRGLTILAGDLNAQPWADDLDSLADVPFSDPGRDFPSRRTHASGRVYDYILLSPDADSRYVVGSYMIYSDSPSRDASDHNLVWLDIHD